jgi:hypothetical protein
VQTDAVTAPNKAGMRDGSSAVTQTPSPKESLRDSASPEEQVSEPSETDADESDTIDALLAPIFAVGDWIYYLWHSVWNDGIFGRIFIVCIIFSLYCFAKVGCDSLLDAIIDGRGFVGHYRTEDGQAEQFVRSIGKGDYRVVYRNKDGRSRDFVLSKQERNSDRWSWGLSERGGDPRAATSFQYQWTRVVKNGYLQRILELFWLDKKGVREEITLIGNVGGRNFTDPRGDRIWWRVGSRSSP